MRSNLSALVQISVCLLLITLIQAGGLGLSKGPKRSRISNSGLMPFPRVGRSGPTSWEMAPNDFHDDTKRSKFMQFPRVGRSSYSPYGDWEDYDSVVDKRAGGIPGNGNKNSGMWFGPRLGRLHKRNDGLENDNNVAAYAYLIELYPKQLHYAQTQRFVHEPSTVEDQSEDDPPQHFTGGQTSTLDMSA